MNVEKGAAGSPATPQDPTRLDRKNDANLESRIIDLHIQEYIALRAEQRTRLDSANKIIHYYAIMLAAVIVGLVTVYKNGNEEVFTSVFPLVLLFIPVITIPFVFAQQNEEIIVRNIGDYFRLIKERISSEKDDGYWTWEDYHYSKLTEVKISRSFPLQLTAFFRAGLLIFFSMLSLVIYYFTYGARNPLAFAQDVVSHWSDSRATFYMGVLLFIDWILILIASLIGLGMLRARVSLKEIGNALYQWIRRKPAIPVEQSQEVDKAK